MRWEIGHQNIDLSYGQKAVYTNNRIKPVQDIHESVGGR